MLQSAYLPERGEAFGRTKAIRQGHTTLPGQLRARSDGPVRPAPQMLFDHVAAGTADPLAVAVLEGVCFQTHHHVPSCRVQSVTVTSIPKPSRQHPRKWIISWPGRLSAEISSDFKCLYHSSNPTRSATAHLPFIVGTELSREQPEERHALDGFGPPGEVRRFGSGKTDYRSQTAAVLLSSASAAAHPSAARPPAPVGTMPPLGPSTIHDGRGPVGARSTRAILPSENFWIGPPLAVACARFRTGRAPTPRMS